MASLSGPVEGVSGGGCRLPWFCVYVGYALCLALSLVSVLMVLLYGYNFGPAIALQWILSVLIAFLLSIFVLEPIKVGDVRCWGGGGGVVMVMVLMLMCGLWWCYC